MSDISEISAEDMALLLKKALKSSYKTPGLTYNGTQPAPKNFISHNTLPAYPHLKFSEARDKASLISGYRFSFTLKNCRVCYYPDQIATKNPYFLYQV